MKFWTYNLGGREYIRIKVEQKQSSKVEGLDKTNAEVGSNPVDLVGKK